MTPEENNNRSLLMPKIAAITMYPTYSLMFGLILFLVSFSSLSVLSVTSFKGSCPRTTLAALAPSSRSEYMTHSLS